MDITQLKANIIRYFTGNQDELNELLQIIHQNVFEEIGNKGNIS